MKKLFALLIALVLSISLVSCGGETGDDPTPPEVNPDINIGEDGEVNLPIIDYTPKDED